MPDERVTVPRGKPPAATAKEVDLARILQALQTIDANAAARMKDLRILMLFLPVMWAAIWGVIYFIVLVVTGK